MKREKITKQFPVTMPRLIEANPSLPSWLVRKLMPAPAHWSGTTPRWRSAPEFPVIRCALKLNGNEPVVISSESDLPVNHPGPFFSTLEAAVSTQKDFARNFFSLRGTVKDALIAMAQEHGGFML